MSFKDVRLTTPLPPVELSKGEEQTMKDWLENYRPVRQRTARSQTTKDKAGTLPPAVYSNANASFQLTKLNKRPLRCALLFPMCPC